MNFNLEPGTESLEFGVTLFWGGGAGIAEGGTFIGFGGANENAAPH